MAKFAGAVGYGDQVESAPGVWEDVITEYPYFGDIIRNTLNIRDDEKINDDIRVNNSISVVADERAINHFTKIKYVIWAGVYWSVTTVEVKHPRLILSLGEIYNGPKAGVADPA